MRRAVLRKMTAAEVRAAFVEFDDSRNGVVSSRNFDRVATRLRVCSLRASVGRGGMEWVTSLSTYRVYDGYAVQLALSDAERRAIMTSFEDVGVGVRYRDLLSWAESSGAAPAAATTFDVPDALLKQFQTRLNAGNGCCAPRCASEKPQHITLRCDPLLPACSCQERRVLLISAGFPGP